MAEWLRRGLQNLLRRFNSGRRLQNLEASFITTLRSSLAELSFTNDTSFSVYIKPGPWLYGRVAELVYAADLKSAG